MWVGDVAGWADLPRLEYLLPAGSQRVKMKQVSGVKAGENCSDSPARKVLGSILKLK